MCWGTPYRPEWAPWRLSEGAYGTSAHSGDQVIGACGSPAFRNSQAPSGWLKPLREVGALACKNAGRDLFQSSVKLKNRRMTHIRKSCTRGYRVKIDGK